MPFKDRSGRYYISYNGEIYNFKEIKNQIEKPDDLRTTNSLFLLSFIYVCIELNRKTIGNMIGKRLGM